MRTGENIAATTFVVLASPNRAILAQLRYRRKAQSLAAGSQYVGRDRYDSRSPRWRRQAASLLPTALSPYDQPCQARVAGSARADYAGGLTRFDLERDLA